MNMKDSNNLNVSDFIDILNNEKNNGKDSFITSDESSKHNDKKQVIATDNFASFKVDPSRFSSDITGDYHIVFDQCFALTALIFRFVRDYIQDNPPTKENQ